PRRSRAAPAGTARRAPVKKRGARRRPRGRDSEVRSSGGSAARFVAAASRALRAALAHLCPLGELLALLRRQDLERLIAQLGAQERHPGTGLRGRIGKLLRLRLVERVRHRHRAKLALGAAHGLAELAHLRRLGVAQLEELVALFLAQVEAPQHVAAVYTRAMEVAVVTMMALVAMGLVEVTLVGARRTLARGLLGHDGQGGGDG